MQSDAGGLGPQRCSTGAACESKSPDAKEGVVDPLRSDSFPLFLVPCSHRGSSSPNGLDITLAYEKERPGSPQRDHGLQ